MILVTGGSGVVGEKVVDALLQAQQQVRVLTRGGADWAHNPLPHFRRSGVEIITCDLRDQDKLASALNGVRGVINLAAIICGRESEMKSVNVDGLVNLVAQAQAHEVQRFVHVSCLGATQFSPCYYFRSKWQGEAIVRAGNFHWTIFRPSLIFSPRSQVVRTLDYTVNALPFIPVIGSGLNRIQLISAEDVAACVVQGLYNRETSHQSYDLVGPVAYSLSELLEMSARASDVKKPLVNVPLKVGSMLASIVSRLNNQAPVSEDLIKVLITELTADDTAMRAVFQPPMLSYETQFKRLAGSR